jgi:hypothetical protein
MQGVSSSNARVVATCSGLGTTSRAGGRRGGGSRSLGTSGQGLGARGIGAGIADRGRGLLGLLCVHPMCHGRRCNQRWGGVGLARP